jgi:hypothetical protein
MALKRSQSGGQSELADRWIHSCNRTTPRKWRPPIAGLLGGGGLHDVQRRRLNAMTDDQVHHLLREASSAPSATDCSLHAENNKATACCHSRAAAAAAAARSDRGRVVCLEYPPNYIRCMQVIYCAAKGNKKSGSLKWTTTKLNCRFFCSNVFHSRQNLRGFEPRLLRKVLGGRV